MKLALAALTAAVALAAAVEGDDLPSFVVVKICGDDLSIALNEACSKRSVNYLLKHGIIYDKESDKELHRDHHHHDHTHDRDHSHDHDHHDSSQAEQNDDQSIVEKCCHKPCMVKEFLAFCGDV